MVLPTPDLIKEYGDDRAQHSDPDRVPQQMDEVDLAPPPKRSMVARQDDRESIAVVEAPTTTIEPGRHADCPGRSGVPIDSAEELFGTLRPKIAG